MSGIARTSSALKHDLARATIVKSVAVVGHHWRVDYFRYLGVNVAMAGGPTLDAAAWMQSNPSNLTYGHDEASGL
jgi:hypothetical protein